LPQAETARARRAATRRDCFIVRILNVRVLLGQLVDWDVSISINQEFYHGKTLLWCGTAIHTYRHRVCYRPVVLILRHGWDNCHSSSKRCCHGCM
jgi:hypothetical protein